MKHSAPRLVALAACGLAQLAVQMAAHMAAQLPAPVAAQVVAEPQVKSQAQGQASPAKPQAGDEWVRIDETKDGKPRAMQTAIVRYVPRDLVQADQPGDQYDTYVDLVGAVHIGDAGYYRDLNRRFRSYDAVLYELVAEKGVVVPRGRGTSNTHPLGALQNGMKSMLELEHQLEKIDYTQRNFIHADFTPEQLAQSMQRREEGVMQMFAKLMGASLAQQSQQAARGQSADVDLMAAFFAPDRARQLKIAMAKQFEGMEAMMTALNGPDGSTLITERNGRALEVLKDRLARGDRKIAIFYGAGHLSDMDERLEEEFNLVPVNVEWLDAWDLR